MPKIHIPQKNLTLDAPKNENLMFFLKSQHIPVASSCTAEGICGKCHLKITGDLPKPNKLEQETLHRNKIDEDHRLSCLVILDQDITVEASYW